jgi:hypothetical protein
MQKKQMKKEWLRKEKIVEDRIYQFSTVGTGEKGMIGDKMPKGSAKGAVKNG